MCGIAGWLGNMQGGREIADRVLARLHHRGPDGQGVRAWPTAALVHTRLGIIDLSPAGDQPMANEDESVWVVFNGEIYNHRELQQELESKGHVFKGHCDAEVLPHLYEEEGTGFVQRLRGMFALGLYDTRNDVLLLARDRFGIKPLFYAPANDQLAFASELGALRVMPGIDDRPNHQAISDYAALFYVPAPETFYSGIRALRPGELLKARLSGQSSSPRDGVRGPADTRPDGDGVSWGTHAYHRWKIAPETDMSLTEAVDRAEALVVSAVSRQMESDVPLGALLSGGIDSSLVCASARRASDELRTFNVRFAEKKYDETWAAVAVARHIQSLHQTLDMKDAEGTWDFVTGLLRHAGQPFADTSLFPTNSVCAAIRQYVKVALSGDGGDEGFGGYRLYGRLGPIALLQSLPLPLWRGVWHGTALVTEPFYRLGFTESHPQRVRDMVDARDDTAVVQNMFCVLHENEHAKLCRRLGALPVRRLFESQWEHSLRQRSPRAERLSALATEVNVRLQMANAFLFKMDTASMKEGLEVRVPMLDEDLFAFGLTLPHGLKVNGRTCKIVLRELARRWLPSRVAEKPKRGFTVPVDTWVGEGFKRRLQEEVLGPGSRLPEFFEPQAYRPVVEAFCAGRRYPGISRAALYRQAIMLLSVHLAI